METITNTFDAKVALSTTDLDTTVETLAQLKELHTTKKHMEELYEQEQAELQAKYEKKYDALYQERRKCLVMNGESHKDGKEEKRSPVVGDEPPALMRIPDFWLTVLLHHHLIGTVISEKDTELLHYLTDIRYRSLRLMDTDAIGLTDGIEGKEMNDQMKEQTEKTLLETDIIQNGEQVSLAEKQKSPQAEGRTFGEGTEPSETDEKKPREGFTLEFEFQPNPFFHNAILRKTYEVNEETAFEEEAVLENIHGTRIDWKDGHNYLFQSSVKKQKNPRTGKLRSKKNHKKIESFFHFFTSLPIPTEDDGVSDEQYEAMVTAIDEDFQIGYSIKETIIPNAVMWYTGEMEEEEDVEEGEEEGEEEEEEDDDSDEDFHKSEKRRLSTKQIKGRSYHQSDESSDHEEDQAKNPNSNEKPGECKNQ